MLDTLRDLPMSIQERWDNQVTVRVPATANRKAYEYTRNGGGTGRRKANVGLGVGLAVGSAAILGGLAATAAAKKGERDADRKKNSEAAERSRETSRVAQEEILKKVEQQRAEYEAKTPRETPEQIEAARKKSADLQERMKKPIETAEESDARRREAGAKARKEYEEKKAREKEEEAANKKKKAEEDWAKEQERRKTPEYKQQAERFRAYLRDRFKEYEASPEGRSEKLAEKAARDLKKEGMKGKGRKAGGGFGKRVVNDSLYKRIDSLVLALRSNL